MRPSLTLRLLASVSWPHWAEHRLRTLLTVVGVAMGVATVVAIADVSESVLASFRYTVDSLAGPAELEISNPGAGVDEGLLEEVQAVSGVREAGGLVEAFLPLRDQPGEQLLLLGVDFLNSHIWDVQFPRSSVHVDDELTFLAQIDSVALPKRLLERIGLGEGGNLEVLAPTGPRRLRVRGILDDQGPARLFAGGLALMDIDAARTLLGKRGRFDRIAIRLDPSVERESVRSRLQAVLGSRAQVSTPEERGDHAEKLLFSLRTTLMIMSLGSIIVGAFIVFQTVTVSVQERRRRLAILNAVGVRRRSLLTLCIVEAVLLALLGSAFGIVVGQLLARASTGLVGGVASDIWARVDATQHGRSLAGAMTAVAVGVLTAAGSAFSAAYAALAAPTVESLRPGAVELDTRTPTVRLLAGAGVLLIGVWAVVLAPPNLGFVSIVSLIIGTQALGYVAVAILAPVLVGIAGSVGRTLVRGWTGFSARLAAENLPRSLTRSSATVAGIAAAFGIAVVVAMLSASFERAWIGWIQEHFGADLYVGRGDRVRLISGPPMSIDIAGELAKVPGVQGVEPFRVLDFSVEGRPVFLQGLSVSERMARDGIAMTSGSLADAAPALLAGTAVLLSENLAYRLGLARGAIIDLPTLHGQRHFQVAGVFTDYLGSLDLGSIAVDFRWLDQYWGDRSASLFRVWLDQGASPTAVRAAILSSVGDGQGLYVVTASEFLDGVRDVIQAFFSAVWGLEVVAALVGLIGIVNAQVAAVVDRSRELSVLRAIGIPGRAITRMIVLECAQIGLLGGILGAAIGAMLGAQIVLVSLRLVTGWRMALIVPTGQIAGGVVLVTVISAAAGYLPAQAARRLTLVPVVAE